MPEFISEPIVPLPGAFTVGSMARAEPGLPGGFRWRGEERRVTEVLEAGKKTGLDMGEAYVRRHTWRLRMDDGAVWNVYFLRQPKKGASGRGKFARWFLLNVESG